MGIETAGTEITCEIGIALALGLDMRHAIDIFVECIPVLCAVLVPVANVVRGGSPIKAFFFGWGLILISFVVFTLVIPLVLYKIDENLGHKFASCFPEPSIVVAMIFFGWFYAGIPILIGIGIRRYVVWKTFQG